MADDTERPQSFLRCDLRPSWSEEIECTLTEPVFDFVTSTHTGAAYRYDGSLIVASLRPAWPGHWRHVDPLTISRETHPRGEPDFDEAIFGGHCFFIWGHFLYETLATAVLADALPDCPVIFAPFAQADHGASLEVWENFRPLLAAAGWGRRRLVLQTATMRFNRLVVPQRLTVYGQHAGRSMGSEMAAVYERIRTTIAGLVTPTRSMVARRPAHHRRTHPAEERVYAILAERGFSIVDGANLPAATQVALFAGATELIGFAGSNLHNSLFCAPGTPVLEIGDRESYERWGPDKRNLTQVTMCELLGQPCDFVPSFEEREGELRPREADDIVGEILLRIAARQWAAGSQASEPPPSRGFMSRLLGRSRPAR